jgi:hypothetical protein
MVILFVESTELQTRIMKRLKVILSFLPLLLLLFVPVTSQGQNEANFWYFGGNAGMDFNGGPPVALTNGAMNTVEGCAAISDGTTGGLLFYTDGVTVYNRLHVAMTNGTGLMGNSSSTQSCIIVPQPGNANLYYVFTVDDIAGPNGMRYSIVDMSLNSGFGDVTGTKNVLMLSVCTEKLTTACHSNGDDYWVITHGWNSSDFYAWQISSAGLNATPVVSTSGAYHGTSSFNTLGELEVSPDATRIALCSWYGTINQVFDFNAATGVVSNPITLTATGEDYGCAFSPDGTKVYYVSCCASPNDVVQFDLSAGTPAQINASRTILANSGSTRGHAQIGPDGKVYISRYFNTSLAVINNPNAAGVACNYVEVGFNLAGRNAFLGLPNMVSCLVIVLDLEFESFVGELNHDGEADLHWEAVEERNKGIYQIERSPDAAFFYTIGEVPFTGKGEGLAQRDFTDRNPLRGTNFYRIRYTDSNGESSVSEVVTIEQEAELQSIVSWSPNPATDYVELQIEVSEEVKAAWKVEIYTAEGRLVRSENLGQLPAGLFSQRFDLDDLSDGFYYFQVKNRGQKAVQSVIVRK